MINNLELIFANQNQPIDLLSILILNLNDVYDFLLYTIIINNNILVFLCIKYDRALLNN